MKKRKQSGQVLLITIMLLATVLTVVLSTSFKSTTDIKIAKLEEESQKALSAAESAVEEALKISDTVTLGVGNLSSISGFSGGATIAQVTSNTFTTTLLQKDEQYTLYVGAYDAATKTVGNSVQEDIVMCFSGSASDIPAVEVTLVKQNSVKKYVIDPNGTSRITNATSANSTCAIDTSFPYWYTIPAADIGTNTKLLVARMIYGGGKILFNRASTSLPAQGRIVSSEARSSTGVTKAVELFQSYPQIPAEFFVTSF